MARAARSRWGGNSHLAATVMRRTLAPMWMTSFGAFCSSGGQASQLPPSVLMAAQKKLRQEQPQSDNDVGIRSSF